MEALLENVKDMRDRTTYQKDHDTLGSVEAVLMEKIKAIEKITDALEIFEINTGKINDMEKVGHAIYREQCEEVRESM